MNEYAVTMSSDAVRLIAKALAVYSERWAGGDPVNKKQSGYCRQSFRR